MEWLMLGRRPENAIGEGCGLRKGRLNFREDRVDRPKLKK